VRPDTRRFDLSILPEGSPVLPDPEGDFAVAEKTLHTGPRRIACLFRLATADLPPEYGPQAWSLSVRHDPGLILRSTIVGRCPRLAEDPFAGVVVQTVFDHDGDPGTPALDPYPFDLGESGFKTASPASAVSCSGTPDPATPGLIAAAVMHQTKPMTLHVNTADTILRVTYDVMVQPGANPDLRIWYEDDLTVAGCSCPVTNVITASGTSFAPTGRSGLILRLEGRDPPFLRGDVNADGAMDVSDPISILGFLFLHEPEDLTCRKGADTDDSGVLDITDGVLLLNHLFLGAGDPPPPHRACGDDPTPDLLGCEAFGPCGG
jgi:hypothetical protein